METVTYSHARQNLAKTMDMVEENRSPLLITRQNGAPVVMISLSEFNALEETAHLLSSPANAERLAQSIKHARAGKSKPQKLVE